MALNPTISLDAISGIVKKIAAVNFTRDMRSDALWHSTKASTVSTVPTTLSNANKEWIVWEQDNWVKVKFAPDSAGADGQGFTVQAVGTSWTVDALTGTVYVVRAKYITPADSKATIYANTNRQAASVGNVLFSGDAILCAKSGASFTLKIATDTNPSGFASYAALGIVQIGLTD